MTLHFCRERIAIIAVAMLSAESIAYAQQGQPSSTELEANTQRYGETQIGYPSLRASRTLPSATSRSAAPIPAEPITVAKNTSIRQLPKVAFPGAATDLPRSSQRSLARKSPAKASKGQSKATKLLAGLKPRRRNTPMLRNTMRSRKTAPAGYRDMNRLQANLKGVAIDGMSSINYQRLLGQQWALGVAAQHFQYTTLQDQGSEEGSGLGGKLFARLKPFRSRNKHEGIFVSMGLGMMAMEWEQAAAIIGGGERLNQQQGLYNTLSGGVSYQTPLYGAILVEPRLDYVLFTPVDSDSSKAVQRFEPTIALGFGF